MYIVYKYIRLLTDVISCFQTISVTVEVVFTHDAKSPPIPSRTVSVAEGTNGFKVLQLASQKTPSFTFKDITDSLGHYITSINGVLQDTASKLSWFIYKNGVSSQVGIDEIIPANGDTITFKYEKY
jgi:hypothetical protein